MKISILDTTLRDGTQGEAVSFTVEDKLMIAQKLDELGIDYIEGGWPGSNPKDKEFFSRARELHLKHARLTAFGSTRFAKNPVDRDPNVRALLEEDGHTVWDYASIALLPALDRLASASALITDYQLGSGENGLDFAHRFHAANPAVRIVIVTSHASDHLDQAVAAASYLALLRKPVRYERLHAFLHP